MVIISCVCGETAVRYYTKNQVPRVLGSCCCYDCQKRVTQQSQKELDLSHPINIWYLDNKLKIVKGQIEFKKVYEDAPMTNMFAKCCNTCLGGRRPDYHFNAVYVTPNYCGKILNVNEDTLKEMKTTFLAFPHDWPVPKEPPINEEEAAQHQPPQIWFNEDKTGVTGTEGYLEAFLTFQECVKAPLYDEHEGHDDNEDVDNCDEKAKTMEEIIESTKATVGVIE